MRLAVDAALARGAPAPAGVRVLEQHGQAVAEVESASLVEALALADAWLAALKRP